MNKFAKISLCVIVLCAAVGGAMVGITCLENGTGWISEAFTFVKKLRL